MSIVRVNGASWGIGDKLTSAQMNGVDINTTYAIDKRSGQTDTVASVLSLSGAGRLIEKYAAGADADTAYLVSGANSIIDVATLTADRVYTLSNTTAVAGDRIMILNRSSYYVTVKNAAAATLIVLGSLVQSNGESSWAELLHTGTEWVLFRSERGTRLEATAFTSSGSWVAPRGVYGVLITAWGGGGGGGGGTTGTTSTTGGGGGGGGGGGALRTTIVAAVTPAATYTVTIGAGGTGGPVGTKGTDGGDTEISGTGLAHIWMGARGGGAGEAVATSSLIARGGLPVRQADVTGDTGVAIVSNSTTMLAASHFAAGVGVGGAAFSFQQSGQAGTGGTSSAGGSGGAYGAIGGSDARGGSGGGGGGGGNGRGTVIGNGGAGGAGGNGSATASAAQAGTAGSSPAQSNVGAGGGGGGAGGQNTGGGSVGTGGLGGDGSAGYLLLIPLR
jgi:hypothetical protein